MRHGDSIAHFKKASSNSCLCIHHLLIFSLDFVVVSCSRKVENTGYNASEVTGERDGVKVRTG